MEIYLFVYLFITLLAPSAVESMNYLRKFADGHELFLKH